MNAIFKPFIKLKKSKIQVKLSIEGFRLAHLKPNFNYKGDESVDLFYYVFTKLLKARTFKDGELNLAHFAARSIGPNWFTQSRVKENNAAQRIVDEHWANYLAIQVIPCGFPQYKAHRFRVFLRSPHFMARQMGFSQAIPSPYSMDLEKQIFQFIPNSSKEIKQFMSDNLLTRTFYDPIDCEPSRFVTRGFIKWWDAYYKKYNRSLNDIVEGGYSRSPSPVNIETSHAKNVDKTSKPKTTKLSSLPTNKDVFLKVVPLTPHVPIQPGTNRGIQIDPRVQFQERLEEARAENVERVKQSVRPLPLVPVINIEADDELDNLLKLIDQPLEVLQKDAYWNNELPLPQSCPYKRNCETLATAETNLKEKDALYEKHLKDANVMLEDLSIERNDLVKKLAEIQAHIQEIDNKTSKIKKPLDRIQEKKLDIQDKLSEVKESQKLNEEDLKNIEKEDDQETQFFRNMCEEKIQLKETLEVFLKEIDG
ncbi:hypothetical protein PIB30_002730 [Stylosanthes scabra]|uniref:Uncharacterized protein n=1 Tax=Stylosanthes scabra TaxID=79078 RepID=A0ABU6R4F3_9FABA|nr:hypothetical protein [Stylosanthes scabra]